MAARSWWVCTGCVVLPWLVRKTNLVRVLEGIKTPIFHVINTKLNQQTKSYFWFREKVPLLVLQMWLVFTLNTHQSLQQNAYQVSQIYNQKGTTIDTFSTFFSYGAVKTREGHLPVDPPRTFFLTLQMIIVPMKNFPCTTLKIYVDSCMPSPGSNWGLAYAISVAFSNTFLLVMCFVCRVQGRRKRFARWC